MPVVVSGEAAGYFVCTTAESGWDAVKKRVQRVADVSYQAASGQFELSASVKSSATVLQMALQCQNL
jgi:hypothetical protein